MSPPIILFSPIAYYSYLEKKTNYIKSSEKQNQNSECFEMRDNNCNK